MAMQMMMVFLAFLIIVCMGVCSSNGSTNINGHELSVMEMEMEMEMDSEINRRMLWGIEENKYISYGALRGETVPCSTPGAPYYNCHGGSRPVNRYTRGCEVITRCARDASP
ncbi:hypothetical protein J5N97_007278 [Dioscorea zingiberensis]|uniref:Rapid ALkalinization Factor n=1 Tax=Dioscorea zingiberensis TaxID=325984 RepID=A0A9D5HV04_9LILI|nr:hypothetical protein J5N97_007278 [Dioscorea zingiberensis]